MIVWIRSSFLSIWYCLQNYVQLHKLFYFKCFTIKRFNFYTCHKLYVNSCLMQSTYGHVLEMNWNLRDLFEWWALGIANWFNVNGSQHEFIGLALQTGRTNNIIGKREWHINNFIEKREWCINHFLGRLERHTSRFFL